MLRTFRGPNMLVVLFIFPSSSFFFPLNSSFTFSLLSTSSFTFSISCSASTSTRFGSASSSNSTVSSSFHDALTRPCSSSAFTSLRTTFSEQSNIAIRSSHRIEW